VFVGQIGSVVTVCIHTVEEWRRPSKRGEGGGGCRELYETKGGKIVCTVSMMEKIREILIAVKSW
jgi:hypothetical protein